MANLNIRKNSSESQSEQVFRVLEEKIIKCELRPGQIFTERDICEITGFGRTPVREAILRLSYGLLIEVLPRRGIKIAAIRYHATVMAMEVRILLERLIIERAIENSGSFERRQFSRFAKEMRRTMENPDKDRHARVDDEFNRFLAETGGHIVATRHSIPLHTITRRIGYMDALHRGSRGLVKSAVHHAELCEALSQGDKEGCYTALQNLYDLNMETLEALLEVVSADSAA